VGRICENGKWEEFGAWEKFVKMVSFKPGVKEWGSYSYSESGELAKEEDVTRVD